MEEMFDEGKVRGMDLGREEGYNLAKQGFDGIVKGLKAREAAAPKVDTTNAGTQTNPPTTTTTSVSVQTNSTTLVAMSQLRGLPENQTCGSGPLRCMAVTSLNFLLAIY